MLVEKFKFKSQYTLLIRPWIHPVSVCEEKRLMFEFHLVISAHSTLNSQVFVFLNPENVYFFKIFIDGFCLSEREFLNSIYK